jgi:mRNA interferase RelE/StbE
VYTIELKPSAVRDMQRLPHSIQTRVAQKIDALANDPVPHGSTKLEAQGDLRRIRVGDYRVIYQVRQKTLVIFVIRVKKRGDVYRP